ncbi:hypothetical protein [Deinococcus cellulosilyticus]|uniref:Uncharacterized protein n=1 Tax=Deinococcus cellulosilyticus (strain DSM 18568 / NBRC 106333 / KACC 11606 / 5516J-15) TaxID=1223518 RepID=A0A511NAG1_DEIC1|nr:hypothetical protein [Deinococcus cellulosilyticus]GEM49351.1 hypothetical protein DC3_49860 [Deinococcus cellulosilyticus NBRC 106333 = KACC 11606]
MSVRSPEWHADDPDQTVLKSLMPLLYPLFDLLEPTFGRCISEIDEAEWHSQNQDSGIWMGDLISLPSPFFVFHQKLWGQLQEELPDLSRDLVSVIAREHVVVVADRDLKDPRVSDDPEHQNLHREALYRISRLIHFGGLDAHS